MLIYYQKVDTDFGEMECGKLVRIIGAYTIFHGTYTSDGFVLVVVYGSVITAVFLVIIFTIVRFSNRWKQNRSVLPQ
jgi:hypothetical protein